MKEKEGIVFSIAKDNAPVPGCTVSKPIMDTADYGIAYFSIAGGTDISAESYGYPKLLLVDGGEMTVYLSDGTKWVLGKGDGLVTPMGAPVGMKSEIGAVYTEIRLKEDTVMMNQALRDGTVFKLAELLPYQEGRIVNRDLISDPKLKFVVMSFDAGTGLSEHAAPGEALVFALDGKGIIGYEGKEHPIQAGECFKFAKGGKHSVKAEGKFKMALLLTLE